MKAVEVLVFCEECNGKGGEFHEGLDRILKCDNCDGNGYTIETYYEEE